jgi:hypothetical protein
MEEIYRFLLNLRFGVFWRRKEDARNHLIDFMNRVGGGQGAAGMSENPMEITQHRSERREVQLHCIPSAKNTSKFPAC